MTGMKDSELPNIEDLEGLPLDGHDGNDDQNGHYPDHEQNGDDGNGEEEEPEGEGEEEAEAAPSGGRGKAIRIAALCGGVAVACLAGLQVPAVRNHIPFFGHSAPQAPVVHPAMPQHAPFPNAFPGQRPGAPGTAPGIAGGPGLTPPGMLPPGQAPAQGVSQPGQPALAMNQGLPATGLHPVGGPQMVSPTAQTSQPAAVPGPDSLSASQPQAGGLDDAGPASLPSATPAPASVAPNGDVPNGAAPSGIAQASDAPASEGGASSASVADFLKLAAPHFDDVQKSVDSAKSAILQGQDQEREDIRQLSDKIDSLAKGQSELSQKLSTVTTPLHQPSAVHTAAVRPARVDTHVTHAAVRKAPRPVVVKDSITNYRLVGVSRHAVLVEGPRGWFEVQIGSMARGQDGQDIPAIGVVQNMQNVDGYWEVTTSTGGVIREPRHVVARG
ncbi:hypothetical protein ACTVH1_17730 [Gluconobacter cerinus]